MGLDRKQTEQRASSEHLAWQVYEPQDEAHDDEGSGVRLFAPSVNL